MLVVDIKIDFKTSQIICNSTYCNLSKTKSNVDEGMMFFYIQIQN